MLQQCSGLYAELIKAQISPIEADQMELWQITALLESGKTPEDDFEAASQRLIEERVRAKREGRDPDLDIQVPLSDIDMQGGQGL